MAKTLAEYRKEQAQRFHKDKQVLVNLLKRRMEWHHQSAMDTDDTAEWEAHFVLLERDQETINQAKDEHEKKRKSLAKEGIELPELEV